MATTLICCSIPIDDAEDLPLGLDRARRAAEAGARLVEWRIDALAEDPEAASLVARLLEESPLPGIITCRPTAEGGLYEGDTTDRVSLLEAIGTGPTAPRYLDFELAEYQRSANIRQKIELVVDHERQARDLRTGLILSTHDFEGRPADLMRRVAALAESPSCAVAKVVWQARSLRDNLEAFDILRARTQPMIVLCMGPFGEMTRILAPKFGGFLTFAALAEGLETAPGQPTVHALRHTHRFDSIGPATRVSASRAGQSRPRWAPGYNAGFDPIDRRLSPSSIRRNGSTQGDHQLLDHDGLTSPMSVTVPQGAWCAVLERGRPRRMPRFRAANTWWSAKVHRPLNTDAPAAIDTLVEAMGSTTADLRGRSVAVIGAGGVARAICAGLLQHGACVTVFNRTETRGRRMVDDLAERIPDARIELGTGDSLSTESFEAYINCTSVGSPDGSDPESSPLPEEVVLDGDVVVFDTIHSAEPTPLLRRAREDGARIATGRAMFIRQAELQFEAWTGVRPAAGLFASTLASD